jgi:hypothetical protein
MSRSSAGALKDTLGLVLVREVLPRGMLVPRISLSREPLAIADVGVMVFDVLDANSMAGQNSQLLSIERNRTIIQQNMVVRAEAQNVAISVGPIVWHP